MDIKVAVCMCVAFGRIFFETAEWIWLKFCTVHIIFRSVTTSCILVMIILRVSKYQTQKWRGSEF